MRLLVALRLETAHENLFVDDNVVYRPDLTVRNTGALLRALRATRIDVLITDSRLFDRLSASEQAEIDASGAAIIVICDDEAWNPAAPIRNLHRIFRGMSEDAAEIRAFEHAEGLHCTRLLARQPFGGSNLADPHASVILVGAGIVNLVTAWRLHRAGFRVSLHDRAPDPRRTDDRTRQGCTFGGEDARIFSFNEARHHHHSGYRVDAATGTQFRKDIGEGGWLACPSGRTGAGEAAWIDAFERIPPWLSGIYNRDIIGFNRESHALWTELRREAPYLFDGVGFRNKLLRLYQSGERFEAGRIGESRIGALIREVGLSELEETEPALRSAIASGGIAGAIEVHGFSVNVHQLGFRVLDRLEADGVSIQWRSELDEVIQDGRGRVTGLRFGSQVQTADHYVLSLGAYGNRTIGEPVARAGIAAMIGMWVTLPDCDPPLSTPLKIARRGHASRGAAEGANVIPGRGSDGPLLHCSAGHGFIGLSPHHVDPGALADLSECVQQTAKDLFPEQFEDARRRGLLDQPLPHCIRPWTSSGLGVFDLHPTDRGGLLTVTGGHNTGGFSQSPAVAEAVLAAFRGASHPMHTLYHPDRCRSFLAEEAR